VARSINSNSIDSPDSPDSPEPAEPADPDLALIRLLRQLQPPKSRNRKRALEQLLALIPKLPGLRKDSHPDYLEALNLALEYVQKNIAAFRCDLDHSSPELVRRRFVTWVNGQLKYRIIDLYRRAKMPLNALSLDAPVGTDRGDRASSTLGDCVPAGLRLDGIETLIEQQQRQTVQRQGLLVELYIERDPEGRLSGCCGMKDPQLNCQFLAQSILLQTRGDRVERQPPEKKVTWRSLAQQLQMNEQTIHSHWKRRCYPMLQAIAQEICTQPTQFMELLGLITPKTGAP